MKRRITVEQLQELTEEQQERLRGRWKPECYDVYWTSAFEDSCNIVLTDEYGNVNGYVKNNMELCLPLLDIGQMIELLQNNLYTKPISTKGPMYFSTANINLCDDLWEAVKQVI